MKGYGYGGGGGLYPVVGCVGGTDEEEPDEVDEAEE